MPNVCNMVLTIVKLGERSLSNIEAHYIIGTQCEFNIDECDGQCLNGTCMDEVNGFRCNSYNGYTGEFCEVMYLCHLTLLKLKVIQTAVA